MSTPAYKNNDNSRNWTIYYDHQVEEKRMADIYESIEANFMVWTSARPDGMTIVWVQATGIRARARVMHWFPDAIWYGSTMAASEYHAWFHNPPLDRIKYRGRYQNQIEPPMGSARMMLEEVMDAAATMQECLDDDQRRGVDGMGEHPIGTLKRT